MRKVEKRLRERIKALEVELEKIKAERQQYRQYFIGKLRWFLELHGKGQSPDMSSLIQDFAHFMTTVESFWWGI